MSFPGLQEANSVAVLSFGKDECTVAVDQKVLFRSPVLTNTILDTDGDTSTVCAPSGFVLSLIHI